MHKSFLTLASRGLCPVNRAVTLISSVIDPLKQYAIFNDRISRKQHWLFALFVVLIAFALGGVGVLNLQVGEPPRTIGLSGL